MRFIPTYVGHTDRRTAAALPGRFIPTYVGHTAFPVRASLFPPVHPHLRGAYSSPSPYQFHISGSSPHTWGIQAVNLLRPQIIRFIPTYVGHTPGSRCPAHCGSVHPHIRGAYAGVQHIQRLHFRFIPTYVGHTIRRRVLPPSCAVHPHIRGAYRISALLDVAILGSSPHT